MDRRIPDLAAANPVVMGLLEYVLDKRDAQILSGEEKRIAVTLDPQRAPRTLRAALAPFNDPNEDDGELWDELVWISRDYRCFDIKPPRHRSRATAPWQGARLYFEDSREPLIREWLDRPRPVLINPLWRAALAQLGSRFENAAAFPPAGLELGAGFESFEQLLSCWASVGEELSRAGEISWRQLSARCFLGDSKYLDGEGRQALARALFPSCCDRIRERPLLMHVYLPEQMEQVLLVENQDSFLLLADRRPETLALVYIEGYRGGAARVRAPGVARFSALNDASPAARQDFLQWWQGQGWQGQGGEELPVYFWGDLDFEGMQISAALKRSFPQLDCWQPGYAPMLERLRDGGGHLPEQAEKRRHREVQLSGCAYADRELIPALKDTGRYVDQEAVSPPQFLQESLI